MRRLLGLEITPSALRGVWATPWLMRPVRPFEVPWDGVDLDAALAIVRGSQPVPETIALVVGLGFLEVARVDLPPAPTDTREHMLSLDPERFLGSNSALQVAMAPESDLAVGCDRRWLERVVGALEGWAPVARVEAAPVALAASGCGDGTWQVEAGHDDTGAVQVRAGRVAALRRGGSLPEAAAPPAIGDAPGSMRIAFGGLRRLEAPASGTLMDRRARRLAERRRWQAMATASLGAAAALCFFVAAMDHARTRTLAALEAEATRLTAELAPAIDAQERRWSAARELDVARALLASRSDPARALAAISTLLPPDVHLTAARMTGQEWHLEGTARQAAVLVPLLDADPRFDNVRSLAASTRFRDGRETRESFSIAFHVGTPD